MARQETVYGNIRKAVLDLLFKYCLSTLSFIVCLAWHVLWGLEGSCYRKHACLTFVLTLGSTVYGLCATETSFEGSNQGDELWKVLGIMDLVKVILQDVSDKKGN